LNALRRKYSEHEGRLYGSLKGEHKRLLGTTTAKIKKETSRRATTAGVAKFSVLASHQLCGSFATLPQVATNP